MATKAAEMAILDKAIAELGTNSYLGPWLASVRGEVERDMRSDLMPSPSLAASQAEASRILVQAKDEAANITGRAKVGAQAVREGAQVKAAQIRQLLAAELKKAMLAIGGDW